MKSWWTASSAGGYTVIEVIIVLGITTGLLFAVILFFNGKTDQAALNQSVRDLESKLQSVATEVTGGNYSNTTITCDASHPGAVNISLNSGTPGQNNGCIFLGKAIGFNSGSNGGLINVINVLGRQYVSGTNNVPVGKLTDAIPQGEADNPDVFNFGFSLSPSAIYDNSNPTTAAPSYGALAFITQLGDSSGNLLPGSRDFLVYGVTGSTLADNASSTADNISASSGSLVLLSNGARICLVTDNGKKAEITVGSNHGALGTNVLIDGGVGSEC